MKKYFPALSSALLLSLCMLAPSAQSQGNSDRGYTRFDQHTVYHSVFNSTAIQPEIARLHQITRASNQVLVNVALVANDKQHGGQPAKVSGSATNLMQQRKELKFKTIDEDGVTYYLAPLRVTDEEQMHFNIQVDSGEGRPYTVKFSKKLYVDK